MPEQINYCVSIFSPARVLGNATAADWWFDKHIFTHCNSGLPRLVVRTSEKFFFVGMWCRPMLFCRMWWPKWARISMCLRRLVLAWFLKSNTTLIFSTCRGVWVGRWVGWVTESIFLIQSAFWRASLAAIYSVYTFPRQLLPAFPTSKRQERQMTCEYGPL